MSFDDGSADYSDIDQIKARLVIAMQQEGTDLPTLCEQAEANYGDALRALEVGTYGFPETLGLFQALSVALGREPNWLATGFENRPNGENLGEFELKLSWEFIFRKRVPLDRRGQLLQRIAGLVAEKKCFTPGAAFRKGVPRTYKDVARIYEEMFPEDAPPENSQWRSGGDHD